MSGCPDCQHATHFGRVCPGQTQGSEYNPHLRTWEVKLTQCRCGRDER